MSGWNAYIATIDYRFPLTALADTAPRGSLNFGLVCGAR